MSEQVPVPMIPRGRTQQTSQEAPTRTIPAAQVVQVPSDPEPGKGVVETLTPTKSPQNHFAVRFRGPNKQAMMVMGDEAVITLNGAACSPERLLEQATESLLKDGKVSASLKPDHNRHGLVYLADFAIEEQTGAGTDAKNDF